MILSDVAPVLRGGRGLKHDVADVISQQAVVAPVLRGGRGLKQAGIPSTAGSWRVAPVLRGGRGLKQAAIEAAVSATPVAPVLRGGRGLKHGATCHCDLLLRVNLKIWRLARIETRCNLPLRYHDFAVAPVLRGGRGLKLRHSYVTDSVMLLVYK